MSAARAVVAVNQIPEGRRLDPDRRPSGPPRPLYKALKRWLVFVALRTVAALVRRAPRAWATGFGERAGRWVYRLDRQRAAGARRRIRGSLGVSSVRARQICADSYGHYGRLIVELMRLPVDDIDTLVDWPHDAERRLREAAGEGRGVIFVTGHVGNWELLAQSVVARGFDGVTVVRRINNRYIDRWLCAERRARGLELIERSGPKTAARMLRALRRGALLGMLIDQRTDVRSVDVPFFGRAAATPVAPAALALRGRCPVVVATIRRAPDGRHRVHVERVPLPAPGDDADRRRALTATLNASLEAAIRSAPSQWVWIHDRWSPGPPGAGR